MAAEWVGWLISLSFALNSASEGSDAPLLPPPPPPPPDKASPCSFSDYLELLSSSPPSPSSSELQDVVWEVAGPAIARALVDRDFRLSRRHAAAFRSTTKENLERVKATSPPTYTSEWLAGSSLLLTLARYLPPLSHHNLAQETLTMTAPTGGSLRKVSGSAVTSILMMADALEAMLADVGAATKRPKRLASIVENR